MAEEIQASETEVIEAGPVRPLPVRSESRTLELWGRNVAPVAIAATAGAAAGVAAVAATRAARAPRRPPRRGLFRKRERVIGSRSFLIDVHLLGK